MLYKKEYYELREAAEIFTEVNEVSFLRLLPVYDKDAQGRILINLGRGVDVYPSTKYGKRAVVRFDGTKKYELIFEDEHHNLLGTFETDSADVAYETLYNALEKDIMPEF